MFTKGSGPGVVEGLGGHFDSCEVKMSVFNGKNQLLLAKGNFVVLYRNFRSLPFLGFIGFLSKAAKSLMYSYPKERASWIPAALSWPCLRSRVVIRV